MAGDAEDTRHGGPRLGAGTRRPTLSREAQRRLGYHLQNLYEPVASESLDQRLLELLEQLDAAKPDQSKPPDEDGGDVLAGPWS